MENIYMKQFYMGVIGDIKNLEYHYAEMAEKGWMLDKVNVYTHRYRAVEPCKMRFIVEILPQITMFDYPENEDAKEYRRMCEDAGWTFITANKQLHVFCCDGENPTPAPIHTDYNLHAQIYLKNSKKYELPLMILPIFFYWLISPLLFDGAKIFLSDISTFMTIGFLIFTLSYAWTIGFVIRWYIRTKKAAEAHLPMPAVNRRLSKIRNTVFMIGTVTVLVSMIIGIGFEIVGGSVLHAVLIPIIIFSLCTGIWLVRQINTKQRTRKENIKLYIVATIILEVIALSIVFVTIFKIMPTVDSAPLENRAVITLSDAGVATEPRRTNTRERNSVAVPVNYRYEERNSDGSVNTHVYRAVNATLAQWLYNRFVKDFYKECKTASVLTPEEADFWGAEQGLIYTHENNATELLLINGTTIIRLSAEGEDISHNALSQALRELY